VGAVDLMVDVAGVDEEDVVGALAVAFAFVEEPERAREGDGVEEPQGEAGLAVDVPGGVPVLDEVEQVGADVLGAEAVGRGVEVPGEVGDPAGVGLDRLGGAVAEDQVLGHAAAQWCHGQLLSR